jgi:hypothetical protein
MIDRLDATIESAIPGHSVSYEILHGIPPEEAINHTFFECAVFGEQRLLLLPKSATVGMAREECGIERCRMVQLSRGRILCDLDRNAVVATSSDLSYRIEEMSGRTQIRVCFPRSQVFMKESFFHKPVWLDVLSDEMFSETKRRIADLTGIEATAAVFSHDSSGDEYVPMNSSYVLSQLIQMDRPMLYVFTEWSV